MSSSPWRSNWSYVGVSQPSQCWLEVLCYRKLLATNRSIHFHIRPLLNWKCDPVKVVIPPVLRRFSVIPLKPRSTSFKNLRKRRVYCNHPLIISLINPPNIVQETDNHKIRIRCYTSLISPLLPYIRSTQYCQSQRTNLRVFPITNGPPHPLPSAAKFLSSTSSSFHTSSITDSSAYSSDFLTASALVRAMYSPLLSVRRLATTLRINIGRITCKIGLTAA